MLKACWDCINRCGTFVEEVNTNNSRHYQGEEEVPLNLQTTMVYTTFRLPRQLKVRDKIEISGSIQPDVQHLSLILQTNDTDNVPFHLIADYINNQMLLQNTQNGNTTSIESDLDKTSPKELFPDLMFKYMLEFWSNNDGEYYVRLVINDQPMGVIKLEHDIQYISQLVMQGDYQHIEKLCFHFA